MYIKQARQLKAYGYFFIFYFTLIFLLACAVCKAESGNTDNSHKPLWTPEDSVTLPSVEVKDISSDGKYSLFVVLHKILEKSKFRTYSECILVNNETLMKDSLGSLGNSCIQPHFIGDESVFSYIIVDAHTKKLYVKDLTSKKIIQEYELKHNIRDYRFAPNGKSLIYTWRQDAYVTQDDQDIRPHHLYLQKIGDNFQHIGMPHEVVFPDSSKAISEFQYEWSPDSQKIMIAAIFSTWKANTHGNLYLVDCQDNTVKIINEENGFSLCSLNFSPNGEKVAFIKLNNHGIQKIPFTSFKQKNNKIGIFDFNTHKLINIDAVDIEGIVGWTKDSKNLVVIKQNGTKQQLYFLNIETKNLKLIDIPSIPYIKEAILSRNLKFIEFEGESLHLPREIYLAPFNEKLNKLQPKNISAVHEKVTLKDITTQSIHWKSYDGLEIEGILTFPQGYKEGNRIPLVVVPHGGPFVRSGQTFIGDLYYSAYSPAVFASQGYATLAVNFRGSSGYGKKFLTRNYRDLGGGDFKDMMSGIDYLIDKEIADPAQLFIGGASYGGFMAAWAIGHTDRFKAAIILGGIVDLISHSGVTDIATTMEAYFGGTYWEDYALWTKTSPLRYVATIKTPTLILQGESDDLVPMEQALQIHRALKKREVPTRLILYNENGHSFNQLAKIDGMYETINWLKSTHKRKIQ